MLDRARIVIVGAGIVGCSTADELTRLGWTDVVVLDQGPLFETGGSTSHAPGLVFQVNPARTVSKLAQDTVRIYSDLNEGEATPIWYPVGSFEVATTPERLQELHRRAGYARSWDLPANVIDPDEAVRRLPLLNRDRVLGALHVPGDGLVKAVRAAQKMAERAQARGASFHGNTAVTGIRIEGNRVTGVDTTAGFVRTDAVLIATGVWGPIVGRMAGITMPLMPFRHLYAETGPLPELQARRGPDSPELEDPILRHQDRSMYFKQIGDAYGIGSYRHAELPIEADDLPREHGHSVAHLAEFPDDLFANALDFTRDLLPAVARRPIQRRLNGVFSFTPDANSILGEWPETRGLWLAEAVWVTHGAGVGALMAEWLVDGVPTLDVREVDVRRFARHVYHHDYIRRRGIQQYREVYDIIHPLDQFNDPRGLRLSPFHQREKELGAVFFEGAGWERPRWYEANAPLTAGLHWRRGAWESRNWSPIAGAEHLATRNAASMMDLSPFVKVRVSGRGALGYLQRLAASDLDLPVGRVKYTVLLTEKGGIAADLTITRLATDEFLIVDGAGTGLRTISRIRDGAPADGSVRVEDDTSGWACIGIWGPNAQAIVDSVAAEPLAFGRFASAEVNLGGVPALALRLSYVGEHGWEIYAPAEYALRLWDVLREAGRPFGLVPSGLAAQDSLRLEKGYRLWGQDIHTEYDPFEAGLDFTLAMDKGDFTGRAALVRKQGEGLTRRLAAMVLDDRETVLMGREPILAGDHKVGHVTSAGYGFAVDTSIAYGYLPVGLAVPGQRVDLVAFGVRFPATVVAEPIYDPTNARLRGPVRAANRSA
jgi:glycine cleavage system aminomethyltransferase T/glycine/D-amino acid oxidase-like deaminating enzyme